MVVVPIELCMSLGSRSQEIVPRYRVVRIMPSFLFGMLSAQTAANLLAAGASVQAPRTVQRVRATLGSVRCAQ
jgi:hypothetical protein